MSADVERTTKTCSSCDGDKSITCKRWTCWKENLGRAETAVEEFRRGMSNWLKDYIGTAEVSPKYPEEKFRCRFWIPQTFYKRLKRNLLNHREEYWETGMIAGRLPGKPTNVKSLNCLNMLSSGNRVNRNEDAAYMEGETARQYVLQFWKDVVEMCRGTYLTRWHTAEELDDVQSAHEVKGFDGCVRAIDCSKWFWKNCPTQDRGKSLNTKDSKLTSIQCEAWCDTDLCCWH